MHQRIFQLSNVEITNSQYFGTRSRSGRMRAEVGREHALLNSDSNRSA